MRKPLGMIAAAVAVLAGGAAYAGAAHAPRAHSAARSGRAAAAQRSFSFSVTYRITHPGRHKQAGGYVNEIGRGRFSATLRGAAALEAAVVTLASGVPVAQIARGGTYVLERTTNGNGTNRGLVVVSFSARGLGAVCVSYTQKSGKYKLGDPAVPEIGSFQTLGGTGNAARWRISVGATQRNVLGETTETFTGDGHVHASVGAPRRMSASCRALARR